MISIQMATVAGYRTGDFLGLGNSQIIRVKIESDPDAQDALLICPPGDESAPAEGDRVPVFTIYNFRIALGGTDSVTPSIGAGEKLLYSRNSAGSISAFISLLSSGIIKLNGDGDFVVRFNELDGGIQKMATDINTELGKIATAINAIAPGSYTPTPIAPNIQSAKVENIEVPGVTP